MSKPYTGFHFVYILTAVAATVEAFEPDVVVFAYIRYFRIVVSKFFCYRCDKHSTVIKIFVGGIVVGINGCCIYITWNYK